MHSQAKQDLFVLHMMNNKQGSYLEVGASHPININNTYLLEKNGWKGVSIDNDNQNEIIWNQCRKNTLIITDAIIFDYKSLNQTFFNYLQLDIEPPLNTYKALLRILESGIEFGIITYETDAYFDSRYVEPSRKILKELGYSLVMPDVQCEFGAFEDWYINEKYIDKTLINSFK
jgi:hypothetical protein